MTQLVFLGFIGLFFILILQIITFRSILTLRKVKGVDQFSPHGDDYTPYYHRLIRTHANLYENTPIWLGLLGYALLTKQETITNGLALWFLLARVMQVCIHLVSTHPWAIYIRFTFFSLQIGIGLYWVSQFIGLALSLI